MEHSTECEKHTRRCQRHCTRAHQMNSRASPACDIPRYVRSQRLLNLFPGWKRMCEQTERTLVCPVEEHREKKQRIICDTAENERNFAKHVRKNWQLPAPGGRSPRRAARPPSRPSAATRARSRCCRLRPRCRRRRLLGSLLRWALDRY